MGVIVTQPFNASGGLGGGFSSATTWDPTTPNYNFSPDNLTISGSSGWDTILATSSVSSGKYYWESSYTGNNNVLVGVAPLGADQSTGLGLTTNGYAWYAAAGTYYNNGVGESPGNAYSAGDLISVLLDLDTNFLTFWKDGVEAFAPKVIPAGTYFPGASLFAADTVFTTNFGATAFTYTPPVGYTAIP